MTEDTNTQPVEAGPLLYTAEEVAEALGVSRWQIYRGGAAGTIPSVRLGRSVRFELPAVIAALRRSSAATAESAPPRPARSPRHARRTVAATQHLDAADRMRNALAATSGLGQRTKEPRHEHGH